jgi:NTE family protein
LNQTVQPRRQRPRIGLALGGGVARGWSHIGALRALERLGIVPDIIAGTSVGAVVGGVYLAGKLDILENWARSLTKLRVVGYLDFRPRGGGLIGGSRLAAELHRHLGELRVEGLETTFVAVAIDLVTGHEVWLRDGLLVDGRPPSRYPASFRRAESGSAGSSTARSSVSVCAALGADLVIAVNLNADLIGRSRRPGATMALSAGLDLVKLAEQAAQPPTTRRIDALAKRIFRGDYDGPNSSPSWCHRSISCRTASAACGWPASRPTCTWHPGSATSACSSSIGPRRSIAEGEAAVTRSLPDLRDALAMFGDRLSEPA